MRTFVSWTLGSVTGLFALVFVAAPLPTEAASATLDSMTPTATDMSDMLDGLPEDVEGFLQVPTVTTEGTVYTGVFSVSEEPLSVVTVGGKIVDSWEYDAMTGKVTVEIRYTGGLIDPTGNPMDAFMVALMFTPTDPTQGPPEEAQGMWMSTNLMEWEIIPPSPQNPQFGFELSGPAGYQGYFQMFLPNAVLDLMSQMTGKTLEASDLAVFVDDGQASLGIEQLADGILIDISVTFKDENTQVSAAAGDNVTKSIATGEKLPLSLQARKGIIKQGKTAKLYGWVKSGKKGKTVTIWRKRPTDDEFVKRDAVTTKKDGYYEYEFTARKTAKWRSKFKKANGTIVKSLAEQVKVND
jgi:hypothetical protein